MPLTRPSPAASPPPGALCHQFYAVTPTFTGSIDVWMLSNGLSAFLAILDTAGNVLVYNDVRARMHLPLLLGGRGRQRCAAAQRPCGGWQGERGQGGAALRGGWGRRLTTYSRPRPPPLPPRLKNNRTGGGTRPPG